MKKSGNKVWKEEGSKTINILVRGIDDKIWSEARKKAIDMKVNMNPLVVSALNEWLKKWVEGKIQIPKKEG